MTGKRNKIVYQNYRKDHARPEAISNKPFSTNAHICPWTHEYRGPIPRRKPGRLN